jgi:O-antigen ligase
MKLIEIFSRIRGILLGLLVGWLMLRLGGVQLVEFYPAFMVVVLLFAVSLFDGLRVKWWGWVLLIPLLPMAVNGSYAYELLLYAALWMAIVLGAHQIQKDWETNIRISPMIYILIGFGVLEALVGLARSLGRFAGRDIPFAPMGTIYNRNHFAGFLEILVPLILMIGFAKLHEMSRYGRRNYRKHRSSFSDRAAKAWIFLVIGSLLFLAILFSLSRGGVVAAMVGALVAGSLLYAWRIGSERTGSRVLASGMIVLLLVGALWIGIQPVVERFVKAPNDAEARSWIWVGTTQIVRDNPILGVGAGMHGWAFTRYQDRNPGIFYDYAHNDYLQAAADFGIPAAIVFFAVIIYLIFRSAKACLRTSNPIRAGLIAGSAGGVVALLVHSFVDFNLHIPSNAVLFGLIVGVMVGASMIKEVEVIIPE